MNAIENLYLKLTKSAAIILYLGVFIGSSWVLTLWDAGYAEKVVAELGLALLLTVLWLSLILRKERAVSKRFLIGFIFLSCLATPVTLQSDIYRYIFDGHNCERGVNPYAVKPTDVMKEYGVLPKSELESTKTNAWMRHINHPQLRTIYPAGAQLFFCMAASIQKQVIDPLDDPHWWNGGMGLVVREHWTVFLGWKCVVALIFSAWFLAWGISEKWRVVKEENDDPKRIFISNKNLLLWVSHPSLLMLGWGDGHIDILLLPFIGAFLWILNLPWPPRELERVKRNKHITMVLALAGCCLGAAVSIKWVPLLFVPCLFAVGLIGPKPFPWSIRIFRLSIALTALALPSIFAMAFFWHEASAFYFDSLLLFSREWSFFGFLPGFISQISQVVFSTEYYQSLAWGKGLGLVIAMALYFYLCFLLLKRRLQNIGYCILSYATLLACSPVVNPWYALIFVFLGSPWHRKIYSLWVWPLLLLPSSLSYWFHHDEINWDSGWEWLQGGVYTMLIILIFSERKKFACFFRARYLPSKKN